MLFEDLSEEVREAANRAIRLIVAEESNRGLKKIQDENSARVASGRVQMTNGRLGSLKAWPRQIERDETFPGLETVRGPSDALYVLDRGEIGYFYTRAEWGAKPAVLTYLMSLGLTTIEAERELSRWFHVSLGVVALIRACSMGMGDQLLIGVRSAGVGSNVGTLSLPGGFLKPSERLTDGLIREVMEEVPGLELNRHQAARHLDTHGVFTFGPHNVAPSVTFCATLATTADRPQMIKQDFVVKANHEWTNGVLAWVSEDTVRAVLDGDLHMAHRLFFPRGVTVTQGFAPDVAGPLREQLDHWIEGHQRPERSLMDPYVIRG